MKTRIWIVVAALATACCLLGFAYWLGTKQSAKRASSSPSTHHPVAARTGHVPKQATDLPSLLVGEWTNERSWTDGQDITYRYNPDGTGYVLTEDGVIRSHGTWAWQGGRTVVISGTETHDTGEARPAADTVELTFYEGGNIMKASSKENGVLFFARKGTPAEAIRFRYNNGLLP